MLLFIAIVDLSIFFNQFLSFFSLICVRMGKRNLCAVGNGWIHP